MSSTVSTALALAVFVSISAAVSTAPAVSLALTSFVSLAFTPAQLCVNRMINVARESAPKLVGKKTAKVLPHTLAHTRTHAHGTTTAVGNCLIDYSCKYTYYSMLMPREQARVKERGGEREIERTNGNIMSIELCIPLPAASGYIELGNRKRCHRLESEFEPVHCFSVLTVDFY